MKRNTSIQLTISLLLLLGSIAISFNPTNARPFTEQKSESIACCSGGTVYSHGNKCVDFGFGCIANGCPSGTSECKEIGE